MNFDAYQQLFQSILDDLKPSSPYDDPHYLNYTRLNWARQQRWLKLGVMNEDLVAAIEGITQKQSWMIITEPWCGDASHILPFLHRLAEKNPLITIDYQLRDAPPFLINRYLTHGSKSIPKLIIADEMNNDIAVWGPRPAGCQVLYDQLLADHVEMEQKKIALQQWYNTDKGKSLQLELLAIFAGLSL